MSECPFCNPEPERVFAGLHTDFYCLWSKFEVALGHTLIVPRRHVASFLELSQGDHDGWTYLLDIAIQHIEALYAREGKPKPDGYNIGVNVGAAAGQTVMHAHVHVIPRVVGDVPDPRGGIRNILKGGNYLIVDELEKLRKAVHDHLAATQCLRITPTFTALHDELRNALPESHRPAVETAEYHYETIASGVKCLRNDGIVTSSVLFAYPLGATVRVSNMDDDTDFVMAVIARNPDHPLGVCLRLKKDPS